jgi:hypothetical protein
MTAFWLQGLKRTSEVGQGAILEIIVVPPHVRTTVERHCVEADVRDHAEQHTKLF